MNWIDTPLLVYSAIPDHPARGILRQELDREQWASTTYVLLEVYQVLIQTYNMPPRVALRATANLANSPIRWVQLDAVSAMAALTERAAGGLESADALLLALAGKGAGTLVTTDKRLIRHAIALGVAARNPIDSLLLSEIARWEDALLPSKGLPRILRSAERWLRGRYLELANQFIEATDTFTALPR